MQPTRQWVVSLSPHAQNPGEMANSPWPISLDPLLSHPHFIVQAFAAMSVDCSAPKDCAVVYRAFSACVSRHQCFDMCLSASQTGALSPSRNTACCSRNNVNPASRNVGSCSLSLCLAQARLEIVGWRFGADNTASAAIQHSWHCCRKQSSKAKQAAAASHKQELTLALAEALPDLIHRYQTDPLKVLLSSMQAYHLLRCCRLPA